MEFPPKEVVLKDKTPCVLRSSLKEDAEKLINYLKRISAETEFLQRGKDDPVLPLAEEEKYIEESLVSPYKCHINAFIGGELAGTCNVMMSGRKKIAHRAQVGIAVLQKHWGKGIGSALFCEIIALAGQKGLRQIELSYMEGNARGKALYEKMGFRQTGRVPNAFCLSDGSFRDEISMIKELY